MFNQRYFFKKLSLVFVLWLGTVAAFLYLYEEYQLSEETIKNTLSKQIVQNYTSTTDNKVLGIYNSVTLTPLPQVTETVQVTPSQIKTIKKSATQPVSINKATVYELINDYRETKGLPEVKVDSRLEASAASKAQDMITKNYFEHGNPWKFITKENYKFNYAAENLAINYFSSNSLFNGWKSSPSHNKAMLDDQNQHMGLAFVCNVNISKYTNTCLAVIHFAREQD